VSAKLLKFLDFTNIFAYSPVMFKQKCFNIGEFHLVIFHTVWSFKLHAGASVMESLTFSVFKGSNCKLKIKDLSLFLSSVLNESWAFEFVNGNWHSK
jgi:hypothetical protein